mmetsp:Transcript_8670/g.19269  ORF Transcript_8670/g.19269 Transcript_8670/m.19269 type:complete len:208 (+) Transcript_8670:919-1542(+)
MSASSAAASATSGWASTSCTASAVASSSASGFQEAARAGSHFSSTSRSPITKRATPTRRRPSSAMRGKAASSSSAACSSAVRMPLCDHSFPPWAGSLERSRDSWLHTSCSVFDRISPSISLMSAISASAASAPAARTVPLPHRCAIGASRRSATAFQLAAFAQSHLADVVLTSIISCASSSCSVPLFAPIPGNWICPVSFRRWSSAP